MKTENTNNVQKDENKDINKHKLINKVLKISCLSLAVMAVVLDLVYALGIFKISKYILVFVVFPLIYILTN